MDEKRRKDLVTELENIGNAMEAFGVLADIADDSAEPELAHEWISKAEILGYRSDKIITELGMK